jgi:hypothetical protein
MFSCYHLVISSHVIISCIIQCNLALSSRVLIPMLSSCVIIHRVIISCYNLVLSSQCYHLELSSHVIISCYHPNVIISCYHPILSSHVIIPYCRYHVIISCYHPNVIISCYHLVLSCQCYHLVLSSHIIIPCYHSILPFSITPMITSNIIIPTKTSLVSSHVSCII